MHQFNNFDLIIFDCDGVLLDSNRLKIRAMEKALKSCGISSQDIKICKDFFANNFGKSRFYHVDYFANELLDIKASVIQNFKNELLDSYSEECKSLYLIAEITPFTIQLLTQSTATKYVASGSEQNELREVFKYRHLTPFFKEVFGSPEKKNKHVANILKVEKPVRAVMIGDAISDLEAARDNNIDFIFYSPFSSVTSKMRELCLQHGYRVIDSFEEVLQEI